MRELYRARDLKLKREVAIKILPEEFAQDSDRVGRFQREAMMAACCLRKCARWTWKASFVSGRIRRIFQIRFCKWDKTQVPL